MIDNSNNNCNNESVNFENFLKDIMNEQSISIRQLSRMTDISAPTISRILSGKQGPSVHHLQMFSNHLNIPIEYFLNSMGVTLLKHSNKNNNAFDILKNIFIDFDIDFESIIEDITKELNKLEEYAKTKEGKKNILENFEPKIQSIDGIGTIIDKLYTFYDKFTSQDINEDELAIIGSGLLYFVLTVEVIPDYLYPIGYLDDAIAITLIEGKLSKL